MIQEGIKRTESVKVVPENTAKMVGSGLAEVFATPAMLGLMEKTAALSVQEFLDEGQSTVGIKADISHVAATPVGMTVTCESELISVEGRKLTFRLKCYDEKEEVGSGTHERFIVYADKFQAKADAKAAR
ncbi:MAG: thioesterase family protein [Lachnospiraceae bacterium]|nr:thioesterase family protein [Lachnospiraceae bacterium]